MKGLKIEPVKKKDRETAARFIVELWGRTGEPKAQKEALARLALLDGADYDAFLFELEKRAVGYALARDNGDHVFLRHFVVSAGERRKGLGRACFALLEEEYGHPEFRLNLTDGDESGAAFWPKLGFAPAAVMLRRAAQGAR